MNTQIILEKYIENIIQIMTPYGSGTGFIIDDLIVTNSHVVGGLKEVVISAKKVKRVIASVVYDDPYYVCADFDSYCKVQDEVSQEYMDQEKWTDKAIINVATSGKFSSDRTIKEYADEIWKVGYMDFK